MQIRKVVNKPEDAKPSDIVNFWGECQKDGTTENTSDKDYTCEIWIAVKEKN